MRHRLKMQFMHFYGYRYIKDGNNRESEQDNRIGHNGKRGKRRLRYTTKRKTRWMLENVCRARVIGFRALNALVG